MIDKTGRERILSLLNRIDNKNEMILDLLMEVYRLRALLKENDIPYIVRKPRKKRK